MCTQLFTAETTMTFLQMVLLFVACMMKTSHSQGCPQNCLRCSANGVCMQCKNDYFGPLCDKQCSGCWVDGCNMTGVCTQCQPGFYSLDCNVPCSSSCKPSKTGEVHCGRYTGDCLEGCKPSHWGSTCNDQCPVNCNNDLCYKADGVCLNCMVGYYGTICSDRHIPNPCPKGFYGPSCSEKCSAKCLIDSCGVNGECIDGCDDSYHGTRCEHNCSKNCVECEQSHGACTKCVDGLEPPACQTPCQCDKSTDAVVPLSCLSFSILGFIFVVIFICVIFANPVMKARADCCSRCHKKAEISSSKKKAEEPRERGEAEMSLLPSNDNTTKEGAKQTVDPEKGEGSPGNEGTKGGMEADTGNEGSNQAMGPESAPREEERARKEGTDGGTGAGTCDEGTKETVDSAGNEETGTGFECTVKRMKCTMRELLKGAKAALLLLLVIWIILFPAACPIDGIALASHTCCTLVVLVFIARNSYLTFTSWHTEKRKTEQHIQQSPLEMEEETTIRENVLSKDSSPEETAEASPTKQIILAQFSHSKKPCIPQFVDNCVMFLQQKGLTEEQINTLQRYVGHSEDLFRQLHRDSINVDKLDMSVFEVMAYLKTFIHNLTDPLVPLGVKKELIEAHRNNISGKERKDAFRRVFKKFFCKHLDKFEVTRYCIWYMNSVCSKRKTEVYQRITASKLAIYWCPVMMSMESKSQEQMFQEFGYMVAVLESLILEYEYIF